jgi:hypothetical protein
MMRINVLRAPCYALPAAVATNLAVVTAAAQPYNHCSFTLHTVCCVCALLHFRLILMQA